MNPLPLYVRPRGPPRREAGHSALVPRVRGDHRRLGVQLEHRGELLRGGDPALPDGVPSPLPHQLAGLHQVRGGGPRAGRALLQGAQQGS